MAGKIIHPSNQPFQISGPDHQILAVYIPDIKIDDRKLWNHLAQVNFTRVYYISQYTKPNRTPRLTWTWAHVHGNMPNPNYDPNSANIYNRMKVIPNTNVPPVPPVKYRGLNFHSEVMPPWLEELSQYCRLTVIQNYNFDPCYNSCIIGKYEDGDDTIAFHRDDENFLAHTFCANVTLGVSRDFQFREDVVGPDGKRQTHEVELAHKSVFFFSGLEHALPKRAGHKAEQGIRYSISFRNMANEIGVGNSMYYCRGLVAAIDDADKEKYQTKLAHLQANK